MCASKELWQLYPNAMVNGSRCTFTDLYHAIPYHTIVAKTLRCVVRAFFAFRLMTKSLADSMSKATLQSVKI